MFSEGLGSAGAIRAPVREVYRRREKPACARVAALRRPPERAGRGKWRAIRTPADVHCGTDAVPAH